MFTEEDIKQFSEKGIDEKTVERQLDLFKTGFPFKKLYAAASAEKGVSKYSESQRAAYVDVWNEYSKNDEVKLVKFVPASGAASRMFKNMFAFLDAEYEEPKTDFEKKFFGSISHFAFYDALDSVCRKLYGKEIPELQKAGRYKEIVAAMLGEQGLNYGKKPKGLLLFHSYDDGARTPVEEHLYEGKLIAAKENGEVNLHFTISPEHRVLFETLLAEKEAAVQQELLRLPEEKALPATPRTLTDAFLRASPGVQNQLLKALIRRIDYYKATPWSHEFLLIVTLKRFPKDSESGRSSEEQES